MAIYNSDMTGVIVAEDETHYVIQFEKSKYCVLRSSIESKNITEDENKSLEIFQ